MIINWKLGLLAFVICSVTLVPALDSAYGKTVRMTHTPTFVGDFSVNSQDTSPEGMAFNTDGTKMFIVGDQNDNVYEYACSTGFDVSTCTLEDTQDVSGQDTIPRGIAFNTAGTKMFILGDATNDVTEYSLDTGFDISDNLTVVGEPFSVQDQEVTPNDLAFNTDGTKMFIVGPAGDDVNEYACSTGFDVSSCSYSGDGERKDVSGQDEKPLGMAFNTDGTKMFIVGAIGDDVYEYACSTGFDVSTCSFTDPFSVVAQENAPNDLEFNTDGTKMFVVGDTGNDVNEYDLDKDFGISGGGPTFQLNSVCAFDFICVTRVNDTSDNKDHGILLYPWLTEGILLDLQPSDRIVDTTTSMPHVQLEPGDTITITLNVQDDLGPDNIKQVSMYTNYGERPIDMNLFYANNFNDKGETSQSFYHWYPNNDDVAYGYDDTIQWKYVSGYTTNADYSELTKDRISISVGDLIHEASTSSEDRLVVSFTATFNEMMSKSNVKVKLVDYNSLYDIVTLPFTIQVGNSDATFEDVMGKHPGYKFIPMLDASQTLESIQQWTYPSSAMTDEQFTQLLGIQETELPSWVKAYLAQWVVEDKIDLAVMIIAIEHLMNLE